MDTTLHKIAIVDATGSGKGKRRFTRDAIGAGSRSVYGVLEKLGVEAKIFLAEDVLEKGFPKGFSSLFISAMSMDKIAVKRVISSWRKHANGRVVVGGPISSELDPTLLSTRADIIVIGEGEKTIKELIEYDALRKSSSKEILEKILGIGYFDSKGKTKINGFRKYSSREEFRLYQASTKCITDYPKYFSAKVYVECVRGCSNFKGTKLLLPDGRQCSECGNCDSYCLEDRLKCPEGIPPGCGFCSVPNLFGPARSRTSDQVVKEIAELLEKNVKRIILSAPDFLDFGRDNELGDNLLMNPYFPKANTKLIEELLSQIASLERVAKGKAWIEVENIKAHLFTEEVARILAKYLPGSSFSIGCETGSESHAIQLGRSSMPKETLRAVKIAHKYGLKSHVYFIHSLPGQTKQTATETVKLIHNLEPYIEKVTIYRFRPLPMSAFGDVPPPEPAIRNPISKMIADAANEVNLRKKTNLVGKKIRVILSEPNYREENGAIANILEGGPMVAVEDAKERIGEIVTVFIDKVITEKLVHGKIVE
ncbi:MAG: B12-binding domain-containing radical SAM protein [Candidatus Heimdallarchaeota archaeon]